uniref:Shugoshin_C domain-containing protein n=1 Tax=Caenorhabditis tropicalis TaxID=1561998 RepID=A0A1I7SY00_9PELO
MTSCRVFRCTVRIRGKNGTRLNSFSHHVAEIFYQKSLVKHGCKNCAIGFWRVSANQKAPIKRRTYCQFEKCERLPCQKNLQLKQQLVQYTKTIEKLRNENVALRERNQELIDGTLEQKVEQIVEQRVKSRLAHAAVLHKKLVRNIQQTGLELSGIFKDLEPEPSVLVTRRQLKHEICLDRLDESPVRYSQSENLDEEKENSIEKDFEPVPSSSAITLANGTPRKAQSIGKGRRSELFHSLSENAEVVEDAPAKSAASTSRRGPVLIAPSATPKPAPKSVSRKAPTPRFKKPSTPAPPPIADDSEMSSTIQVRRQRSAKMNIKSMKEPNMLTKLRRPGKHDEPMPYIDTFF